MSAQNEKIVLTPWREYFTNYLRMESSPPRILFDWMIYACENFKPDLADRKPYFYKLFDFAQFDKSERIDAINVCRSSHFLSELSTKRMLFIMDELAIYDEIEAGFSSLLKGMRRDKKLYHRMLGLEESSESENSDTEDWNSEEEKWISIFRSKRSQAVSLDEDFGDDIPQDFVCPLSLLIMKEPVIASDKHTYEKEEIEKWMRQKMTSPLTRADLLPNLFPNMILKNKIEDWKKAYRKAKTEARTVTEA